MNGVLIVDKQKGWTSHDVVGKVRKIIGIKKVGHAGTLDPMATGVLPILIGDATKASKYLIEHDKVYRAELTLGIQKDTADEEGKILQQKEVKKEILQKKTIELILKQLVGKQEQIPPMYSSVKIKGKKLYEYAREGKKIEVPARQIEIYDMQLLEVNQEKNKIQFQVKCSKGTYIRVLCEEIAKRLGTVRLYE